VLVLALHFAFHQDWLFTRMLKPQVLLARFVFSIAVPWIIAANHLRGGLTKKSLANPQNTAA